MSEDLSMTDRAQLERWAYGRPADAADADRARRAAAELERRAEQRDTPSVPVDGARSALPNGTAAGALENTAPETGGNNKPTVLVVDEVEPPDDIVDEPRNSPFWRPRRLIAAGIVALVVIGVGVALPPLLDTAPSPRSSFAVFSGRETSNEERALLTLLEGEGQLVSMGPRVLGTIEYGTVIGYRSISTEPGEPQRDDICLAVSEFDRSVQSEAIADWRCVDRAVFEEEGASVTLFGRGGQYDVDWGPSGPAQLDVLITQAQRLAMEPSVETLFIDRPATGLEQAYLYEQLVAEQTDVVLEQVRLVFPLATLLDPEGTSGESPDPETGGEWISASTAVTVGSGERLACLSVIALRATDPGEFDPNGNLESVEPVGTESERECLAVYDFDARALSFTVERAGTTIIVTWTSTGEISAITAGTG